MSPLVRVVISRIPLPPFVCVCAPLSLTRLGGSQDDTGLAEDRAALGDSTSSEEEQNEESEGDDTATSGDDGTSDGSGAGTGGGGGNGYDAKTGGDWVSAEALAAAYGFKGSGGTGGGGGGARVVRQPRPVRAALCLELCPARLLPPPPLAAAVVASRQVYSRWL